MSVDSARDVDDDLAPLPGGDGSAPIDFNTFVLSLSASCMIQLGDLASPGQSQDLPSARQTIEILQALEKKTRGNLSGEEERVIHHVLHDLRQRYIAKL